MGLLLVKEDMREDISIFDDDRTEGNGWLNLFGSGRSFGTRGFSLRTGSVLFSLFVIHMEIVYIEDYPKDCDPLNAPSIGDYYYIRMHVNRNDPRTIKTIYEEWLAQHTHLRRVQNPTILVGRTVSDPVATVKKRHIQKRLQQP